MPNSRELRSVAEVPTGDGWVHIGCYEDALGLRRTLERIRRLWAERYDFRVVHSPCSAGDYRLYVRHR